MKSSLQPSLDSASLPPRSVPSALPRQVGPLCIAAMLLAGGFPAWSQGVVQPTFTPAEVGTVIGSFPQLEVGDRVTIGEFQHGQMYMAAGSSGFNVRDSWWNISDPRSPVLIESLVTSHDKPHSIGFWGDLFFEAANGGIFRVWNYKTRQEVGNNSSTPNRGNSLWDAIQAPYAFTGAHGYGTSSSIDVWDVSDPTDIVRIATVDTGTSPGFVVGAVHPIGNLLVCSASQSGGVAIYDISDPASPQLLDAITTGMQPIYTSLVYGSRLYTGEANADGIRVFDFSDPMNLVELGLIPTGGNPRYMIFKDGKGYTTPGNNQVVIFDADTLQVEQTHNPDGQVMDFIFPFGNMALITGGGVGGNGARIMALQEAPDTLGPSVEYVNPVNQATNVAFTSRIGISTSEQIDVTSLDTTTFIVRPVGGAAISGTYSTYMGIISFSPDAPLLPNTTYEVFLPAGGVKDVVGNGMEGSFLSTFSTGAAVVGSDGLTHRWRLDGNANDEIGGNHGIADGVTFAAGQLGEAAYFDGTAHIDLGFHDLGDQFTFSTWVWVDSGSTNIQTLLANSNGGSSTDGFRFFINTWQTSNGRVNLETGNGVNSNHARTGDGAIVTGSWNHVAVTVDRAAGAAVIFVNGVDQTVDGTIRDDFNNAANIDMGQFLNGGNKLNGRMDETRFYNRLLTEAEILDLFDTSLRHHWKLNNSFVDDVGTAHGVNTGVSFTNGKSLQAGLFDGASHVDVGPVDLGDTFTISAWVFVDPGSTNIQTIAANSAGGSVTDGFRLFVNTFQTANGRVNLETGNGVNSNHARTGDGAIVTGLWNHVAATVNRTAGTAVIFVNGVDQTVDGTVRNDFNNTAAVHLGNFTNNSNPLNGRLDEVKVFNRELDAVDVAELISDAELRNHWKLDGDVLDSVGLNDGVNNGVTFQSGKIGQSGVFDGLSYADIGNLDLSDSTEFTIASWVWIDSGAVNIQSIFANVGGGFSSDGFKLYVNSFQTSNGRVVLESGDGTSGNAAQTGDGVVPVDTWRHVAVVVDRLAGLATIYVDGVDQTTDSTISANAGANNNATLGSFANETFPLNGQLDDVRIYDRSLTAQEVADLFNEGGTNTPPTIDSLVSSSSPEEINVAVTFTATASDPDPDILEYSFDFGDGSPATPFSTANFASHTYTSPGRYPVICTVRDGSVTVSDNVTQIIHLPLTANAPVASAQIVYDEARGKVWNVNPDNDTVTRIDAATLSKDFEIAVGKEPRSIALRPGGAEIWVACESADAMYILNADTGAHIQTVSVGHGVRPMDLVFAPDGAALYLTGMNSEVAAKYDPATRGLLASLFLGGKPRSIAVSADSSRVFVGRFISPADQGEIWELDAASFTLTRTITLAKDTGPDTENSGRGVPNYLIQMAISPDGQRLWVPAKKDNTDRGQFLDGLALDHDNTVRSIITRVDLNANAEVLGERRDIDDQELPHGVVFSPVGDLAFVAYQGNNEVLVFNTANGSQIAGIVLGSDLAPQGLAINAAGTRLYVHSFMTRTVTVLDISGLVDATSSQMTELASINAVSTETLSAQVLQGKQIFYNAADLRMTSEGYLSCATCHLDGGHDGRTWDFTDRGEGLRNTTNLRGRSGMAHGNVHWSANFDEIQDFELDMVNAFAGQGFLASVGGPNPSLGAPNAGRSAELDALAAYVASLGTETLETSPYLNGDGSMTAAAMAGKQLFDGTVAPASGNALSCTTCHNPATGFTDSTVGNDSGGTITLHDVGTIKPGSGQRLGATLTGIDTPTLLGLHASAPYLHDGSAATIAEVFDQFDSGAPLGQDGSAHNLSPSGYNLTAGELNDLVAYLQQIDGGPDLTAPGTPTGLVATAGDNSVSLDWNDNTESDFASYNVYRSTTPGSYGAPLVTGLTSSDYVDNTAVNGVTYYYVVTAVDGNGNESGSVGESSSTPTSNPGIRVTEYYLTNTDFTGTTTTVTLNQDLANDYYILVRGSRTGDGGSNPDNDYARVIAVPGGRGDLASSGANNQIQLQRQAADFDWEGVVTVVECDNAASDAGFRLVDAVVTSMTTLAGTDTSASWTDVNQVVLFGGYRGGGVEIFGNPNNRKHGTSAYTRVHPSGSNTINWSRDAGGETLFDATMTTFVVEWGGEWNIQRVNVAGNNGGNGADAAGEYTTAAINSVARDNTWVWGTGTRNDSGIGDSSESCLITLGNGVNQNANETTVAVGSEYTDAYNFDVYVMTHPGLQVDHRFKVDGDSTGLDVAVTVDSANAGARFGWVYNGCNGTGSAFPRPRFWSRYTSDTTVTLSRGYDGQNFPAWVQGIDFSGLNP